MTTLPPNHETLRRSIRTRRERRDRWQREGERSLAQTLGMIGALGWLVVIPILIGILLGRWLDRTWDTGILWTAALLLVGLVAGCTLAGKRIQEP
ncbi:MAG: AtpZ/AtpI family protein [Rhodospirillales bacterium]